MRIHEKMGPEPKRSLLEIEMKAWTTENLRDQLPKEWRFLFKISYYLVTLSFVVKLQ